MKTRKKKAERKFMKDVAVLIATYDKDMQREAVRRGLAIKRANKRPVR